MAFEGSWCHSFIVNSGLQEYQVIGDVRGEGLMLGIELVENRASKISATRLANRIKEAAKCRERVLIAIEGPHSNVIKIKPPIIFSMKDVNQYLAALRKVNSARVSPMHLLHRNMPGDAVPNPTATCCFGLYQALPAWHLESAGLVQLGELHGALATNFATL